MVEVFKCKMCGKCCKGKGGIYLTESEIFKISDYLKIEPDQFKSFYCENINGKLRLVQGKKGYCIFYHFKKQCLIHCVKPFICSLWPFFPANIKDEQSFYIAKLACPGIHPDCSHKDFVLAWHQSLQDGKPNTK